jgi:hypothetical protein
MWSNQTGSQRDYFSSPTVADVDDDGWLEIIVGNDDGNVYCLNRTGGEKWSYLTSGNVQSSPIVVDVEGDGKKEVLVHSWDGYVYCLNATGQKKWDSKAVGSCSSVAVADVDGDCELEVITGGYDGRVYCFGPNGTQEWNYTTGREIYYQSAVVADIDKDNTQEVLIGSDDGYLYCLSVAGAPLNADAYPWPSICSQGSVQYTGCYVDSDGDGLTDAYEQSAGTSPLSPDTDTDGVTDYQEFLVSSNPLYDPNPPATIDNLAVISAAGTSVKLTWTAPGDNGMQGNATAYLVKYSTTGPINASSWATATDYMQSWMPLAGGSTETRNATELDSETAYWFAIEAYDETPNFGGVSNSVNSATLDITPPATITNLAAVNATTDSITLTWTAPGDSNMIGAAVGYTVKYSTTGPITEANWNSATSYTQSWTPLQAGGGESHTLTGLTSNTTYWFAVKAHDDVPNTSGISNSPSAKTGLPPGGLPAMVYVLGVIALVVVAAVGTVKLRKPKGKRHK